MIAARGERSAESAKHDGIDRTVPVDLAPDITELDKALRLDGIQPVLTIESDAEDTVGGPVDFQLLVVGLRIRHGESSRFMASFGR